jgi:hypothetical protein
MDTHNIMFRIVIAKKIAALRGMEGASSILPIVSPKNELDIIKQMMGMIFFIFPPAVQGSG